MCAPCSCAAWNAISRGGCATSAKARLALMAGSTPPSAGRHESPGLDVVHTRPGAPETMDDAVDLDSRQPSCVRPSRSRQSSGRAAFRRSHPPSIWRWRRRPTRRLILEGVPDNVTVSPDGTAIAFVASSANGDLIWIRPLASGEAKPLAGHGWRVLSLLVGGQQTDWVFLERQTQDHRDRRWPARSHRRCVNRPRRVVERRTTRSSSRPWAGGTICRVSAHGGPVTSLTKLDLTRGESAHYWPVFLPGGTQYLYFARSSVTDSSGIYLARLDGSSPAVRIVPSLSAGIPVIRPSTGGLYLIWAREHDLLAQPFDAGRAALTGEAVTIGHDVRVEESQRLAFVGASRTGVLAWASARAALTGLGLFARDGHRIRTLDVVPGVVWQPALSPDDQQLLYTRVDKGLGDIFRYDMRTNVSERLTTGPGFSEGSVWSPDGKAFLYLANERGEQLIRRLSFGLAAPSVVVHRGNVISGGFDTPAAGSRCSRNPPARAART